ncbi:hypothetical protein GUJ93_ZPchr0002g24817 [Zizania palustris]|uniref:Uncharacterized protein n=1 Tax=Zizania palustris TaxID=103762 RepID=A0A8J5VRA1_ZIZPA|nr:hypothetical protein GUJ93_ZPchr0002g24817 [Zizania palustris]
MPSLRHYSSLAIVLEKLQLHHLSTISSPPSSLPYASKMKIIGKAPELLKKAATMFIRSKASALRARFLLVSSLRRRMAMAGTISHRIHALMVEKEKEKEKEKKASNLALIMPRKAKTGRCDKQALHDDEMGATDLSELAALFEQEDHGYPDWTLSLFSDEDCYSGGEHDDHDMLLADDELDDDDGDDEPSVIDIIRSNREDEGLEFNMDDEIDQAADMFIRRIRERMN